MNDPGFLEVALPIVIMLAVLMLVAYVHNRNQKRLNNKYLNEQIEKAALLGFIEDLRIKDSLSISLKTKQIVTSCSDYGIKSFDDVLSIKIKESPSASRYPKNSSFSLYLNFIDEDSLYIDVSSLKELLNVFGTLCAIIGRDLTDKDTNSEKGLMLSTSHAIDELIDNNDTNVVIKVV
jgi:hypothetical protein